MNKLFIVLLSATILAVSVRSACDNPLLDTFGFTAAKGATAAAGSALKYCKTLKAGQSCCNAAIVDKFQDDADALLERLTDTVSDRDLFLVKVRTETIPGLTSKFAALSTAASAASSKLSDPTTVAVVNTYAQIQTSLNALVPQLKSAFASFQISRAACVVKLVTFQTAAWCFACSPAAYTGVVSTVNNKAVVSFSDEIKDTLTDACYNYLSLSQTQSSLLSFSYLSSTIDGITTALNGVANAAQGDKTALAALATALAASPTVTEASQQVVALPAGCTADGCDWIVDTLFEGGKINEDSLALGGEIVSVDGGADGDDGEEKLMKIA